MCQQAAERVYQARDELTKLGYPKLALIALISPRRSREAGGMSDVFCGEYADINCYLPADFARTEEREVETIVANALPSSSDDDVPMTFLNAFDGDTLIERLRDRPIIISAKQVTLYSEGAFLERRLRNSGLVLVLTSSALYAAACTLPVLISMLPTVVYWKRTLFLMSTGFIAIMSVISFGVRIGHFPQPPNVGRSNVGFAHANSAMNMMFIVVYFSIAERADVRSPHAAINYMIKGRKSSMTDRMRRTTLRLTVFTSIVMLLRTVLVVSWIVRLLSWSRTPEKTLMLNTFWESVATILQAMVLLCFTAAGSLSLANINADASRSARANIVSMDSGAFDDLGLRGNMRHFPPLQHDRMSRASSFSDVLRFTCVDRGRVALPNVARGLVKVVGDTAGELAAGHVTDQEKAMAVPPKIQNDGAWHGDGYAKVPTIGGEEGRKDAAGNRLHNGVGLATFFASRKHDRGGSDENLTPEKQLKKAKESKQCNRSILLPMQPPSAPVSNFPVATLPEVFARCHASRPC
ncbi:hypothetical protein THASP1DRAFT_24052 [Thamnocephalis sphaerospora]|uniref:Uncharacterized protein n=1 Tax=Thamnocephalis sphaerospora TaxID=78915 RepID=A0A4P9XPC8_9FUNG|nr:hypothetical protein THASP1DRAFT_24052 [Thamnocephalis sphaerospora]|eukprot:RKP07857.1 hypothetical protein THASP1DRAFT_24052 [Thamnocephalis sphaerospora]